MGIIQSNFFSATLKRNTGIIAVIPADFPGCELDLRQWKPLYLLHGTYGDGSDWIRYSNVERYAKEFGFAAIMVSCGNNFFRNMTYGDAYETFLAEELPCYVEYLFPILRGPEHAAIGGLSMGGYGAMSLAIRHPDRFGRVISLSGGFDFTQVELGEGFPIDTWPFYSVFGEEFSKDLWRSEDVNLKPQIRDFLRTGKKFPAVFQSVGTEDITLETNRDMDRFFTEQHIEHIYREVPGEHDWKLWNTELEVAMRWLASLE